MVESLHGFENIRSNMCVCIYFSTFSLEHLCYILYKQQNSHSYVNWEPIYYNASLVIWLGVWLSVGRAPWKPLSSPLQHCFGICDLQLIHDFFFVSLECQDYNLKFARHLIIQRVCRQVIIDEAITKLDEDFFWLGGGEVDLKLGMRPSEFLNAFNPFVVKCS